ncbi:uncharacterized protein PAC_03055 [Phialocephala subalpina]|uniref:Chorismate mutase domain-containing protein n=1 Tax=Phialocephala subalpina TaxID=576137 RepID=A0A1L7WK77_9HELO|nr:uncharacterized protein PAC_03055 [Phialocephala subalpina]
MHFTLVAFLSLAACATAATNSSECYGSTLPLVPSSVGSENRTIPWGSPALTLQNGTLCCESLNQVRAGIDDVDTQLLELLALRAGYVREATRFKATLDTVDVPSRDQAVIQGAVDTANSTSPPLPATIARAVFEAIINASVPFEQCIFGQFCGGAKK